MEEMGIGGSGGIDAFGGGITYHIQEIRVDIGFSLEIKEQVDGPFTQLIDPSSMVLLPDHSGISVKLPESARAFGTSEIAGSGGFDRDAYGHPPLDGLSGPLRIIETPEDL